MWRLYQFPLCPFSRKVRLLLSEKGVGYELLRANPWDADEELWNHNPVGQTPVLRDEEKNLTLCDSRAICEYFEETVDKAPMISGTARNRAEIRRLVAMFDENFFADVTMPLLHEKMKKRLVLRQPPDGRALREATKLMHAHLDYIDYLRDHRSWLGGAQLSLADLAAAAQISVVEYLDGLDWKGHDPAYEWFEALKCRPSFRPLLSERMEVIQPPRSYSDPDS